MTETTATFSSPTTISRAVAVLISLLVALGASLALSAPAHAAGSCSLSPQAPYKHTRITGQKQVFGKGALSCDGSRVPQSVEVKVAKWDGATQQWYWMNGMATTVTSTTNPEARLTYGFMCNNYGFGSTGSGYYQTYVRGTWMEYGGGPMQTTGWRTSAYRYLSC